MGHVSLCNNIVFNKRAIRIHEAFLKTYKCYCYSNIRKSFFDQPEVNLSVSSQEINKFVTVVGSSYVIYIKKPQQERTARLHDQYIVKNLPMCIFGKIKPTQLHLKK